MTQVEDKTRRPKILVLDGRLSSSADSVQVEGGDTIEASPYQLPQAVTVIDQGGWDGLVLTGGGDIDPRCYDETPSPKVYGVSENRDIVEHYALEAARDAGVPVLGICRGMQMIVVEAGGKLEQHIQGHQGGTHVVSAVEDSILGRWAGSRPEIVSLHHQAAIAPPRHFSVSALAMDGTIEAVESDDGRVLGVQFHPEMDQFETYSQRIFRWLVEESAKTAGIKFPKRRKPKRRETTYYRSRHLGIDSRRPRQSNYEIVIRCPHCWKTFDGVEAYLDRDLHVEIFHDGCTTTSSYFNERYLH